MDIKVPSSYLNCPPGCLDYLSRCFGRLLVCLNHLFGYFNSQLKDLNFSVSLSRCVDSFLSI